LSCQYAGEAPYGQALAFKAQELEQKVAVYESNDSMGVAISASATQSIDDELKQACSFESFMASIPWDRMFMPGPSTEPDLGPNLPHKPGNPQLEMVAIAEARKAALSRAHEL
jgi:hypothetical protein